MTLIIAEAGVNHNGDEALAHKLVDVALESKVDIVKFQTFEASKLATKSANQAKYQEKNSSKHESQYDMLSRLELSREAHRNLKVYCDSSNIEFLSTAFDIYSLRFLLDDIGLARLKIPSGEITNFPLVLEHARSGLDIIVSTGMASLAEIETVLGVIAFGMVAGAVEKPSEMAFREAYVSEQGRQALTSKVTLLHCTTEYPVASEDVNLRAIESMRYAFGLPIGYSDHSMGLTVPIVATALGATVIEKHFTLDRKMTGPDHLASIEPQELFNMVAAVRDVDILLGDGVKIPRPVELQNKDAARKSLVALTDISIGEKFSDINLGVMRPGGGVSPQKYWDYIDSIARSDYCAGDVISN